MLAPESAGPAKALARAPLRHRRHLAHHSLSLLPATKPRISNPHSQQRNANLAIAWYGALGTLLNGAEEMGAELATAERTSPL